MQKYTVKQLKERLKDLPDDMPVLIQRIEDVYFKEYHWSSVSLIWEWWPDQEPETSEYVYVHDAYKTSSVDGSIEGFVINAHY